MIETELHDLSDDADYAASQQQVTIFISQSFIFLQIFYNLIILLRIFHAFIFRLNLVLIG